MKVYKAEDVIKHSKGIHIAKSNASASVKDFVAHTHEFIEIVYILSGKVTHVIDGQKYDARHGDVLFMNYGCTHSFNADAEYTYVNILFSPEMMHENVATPENAFSTLCLMAFDEITADSDFGCIRFDGAERQEIESMILQMLKEYTQRQTSWETVLGNYLSTFIIKLLRKYEEKMATFDIGDIWNDLSNYIESNLNSRLTLSDIANKCFYNPSYFSRLFKEKYGVALVEYITRKRLEKAIEFLQNTELSLDEISRQVGFTDTKRLYHAFSRYLNATPSQYRNVKKRDEKK